jgi:hypothetical protein
LVVLGLFVGAPAQAQESAPAFPDLPGMKLADEATRGEVAPSQAGHHGDTAAQAPAAEGTDVRSAQQEAPPDASSITELPGTGGIPLIEQIKAGLTSSRSESGSMPQGLTALAALGTILSVGGFLIFRRLLVP